MFYIKLGFHNLLKNKRRTMLTLLTIAVGLSCLLVAKGFINYSMWGLRESIINGGTGHFQLFKKGFIGKNDDGSYKFLIGNYKKIIRDLSAVPGIKFIAPRLTFNGLLSSSDSSAFVLGYGGWQEEEKALTTFSSMQKGAYPGADDLYRILVGGGVAEIAGLDIEDNATLSVAMENGVVNAIDFTVSGIIRNQLEEMENVFAYIPLQTAQVLMNSGDAVDTLIVMLVGTAEAETAESQIKVICEKYGLELRTWDQIVPYYGGAQEFYASAMNVAIIVILAILIFSIANTMLMVIFERMREIGTIRSLGTTAVQVFKIIISESLLMALFGCALGIFLSLCSAWIINSLGGITLPPPPGNSRSYQGLIYINGWNIVLYSSLVLFVSALSSIYPSFKSVKMTIADTLRWL